MGRQTSTTSNGSGLVNDRTWVAQIQRYLYRFIELGSITRQMLAELPPDRQHYYKELISGIDKTIRDRHNGTKDNANGDVKSV